MVASDARLLLNVKKGLALINKYGASLLFYLNNSDVANATGKVNNLAQQNQSIVGTFHSNTNILRDAAFNAGALKFALATADWIGFGNNFNYTDDITIFCLVRRDATSSSVFPMVFGKCATTAYYLIMNSTTNQIGFNIGTSGGEKASGYPSQKMVNGEWYWAFGSYDKDAGAGNLRCDLFTIDGKLVASTKSTQTLAISTNAQQLSIARDNLRGQQDPGITVSIGGLFNRQLRLEEELAIVRSFITPLV